MICKKDNFLTYLVTKTRAEKSQAMAAKTWMENGKSYGVCVSSKEGLLFEPSSK
jgi:hypothetical protein